jgi:hypothetical protein
LVPSGPRWVQCFDSGQEELEVHFEHKGDLEADRVLEQLRYLAPGEWSSLLGLDRLPEVRCLRKKLRWLCRAEGRAAQRNAALAEDWMIGLEEGAMLFYAESHVRVYDGELTGVAAALCAAPAAVRAVDHRLLDQRHGRPARSATLTRPWIRACLRCCAPNWCRGWMPIRRFRQLTGSGWPRTSGSPGSTLMRRTDMEVDGRDGQIRTAGLPLRRRPLYPTELRPRALPL